MARALRQVTLPAPVGLAHQYPADGDQHHYAALKSGVYTRDLFRAVGPAVGRVRSAPGRSVSGKKRPGEMAMGMKHDPGRNRAGASPPTSFIGTCWPRRTLGVEGVRARSDMAERHARLHAESEDQNMRRDAARLPAENNWAPCRADETRDRGHSQPAILCAPPVRWRRNKTSVVSTTARSQAGAHFTLVDSVPAEGGPGVAL